MDNEQAQATAIDGADNVVLAGDFASTVDFGGGPLTSAGFFDIFAAKLLPCTPLPQGSSCAVDESCASGFCVDGFCCDAACGGGAPDCFACSAALGAGADGTCALLSPTCLDADNDGLSDDDESLQGTLLNDADSDDDGVLDGQEVLLTTNPLLADSDKDGLPDGLELGLDCSHPDTSQAAGFCFSDGDGGATKTKPTVADTDGGGVSDGDEDSNKNGVVDKGERDPNDPADDIQPGRTCGELESCPTEGPLGSTSCAVGRGGSPAPFGAALLGALVLLSARRRVRFCVGSCGASYSRVPASPSAVAWRKDRGPHPHAPAA